MVTEDYVSFETAKLLEKKGFNWETYSFYDKDGRICKMSSPINWNYKSDIFGYSRPTLQIAMKWQREVHNMHVDVDPSEGDWAPCVLELEDWSSISDGLPACNSYEEACELGIRYALENFI